MPNFPNIDIKHTVCFTGPRPSKLFGYQDCPNYQKISQALATLLKQLEQADYDEFISGGAQGFDQLAFFTVDTYLLYVKNHVFIPYQEQPDRWVENGFFGKQSYRTMLTKASSVTDISDGKTGMPYYECVKYLMKRNEDMVDHSSITVALWWHDKDYITEKGGTAACIRYSLKQGHKVILLDPVTLKTKTICP